MQKIVSTKTIAKTILKLKAKGKKVVLCHGVFDLLHIGHINHFKEAKNLGDILVVSGLLVHKAERNIHPTKWRRILYTVYIKNGEPFWPGWTAQRCLLDRYDAEENK